jgi:hypothetical protein
MAAGQKGISFDQIIQAGKAARRDFSFATPLTYPAL